jgi:hypothetical protein
MLHFVNRSGRCIMSPLQCTQAARYSEWHRIKLLYMCVLSYACTLAGGTRRCYIHAAYVCCHPLLLLTCLNHCLLSAGCGCCQTQRRCVYQAQHTVSWHTCADCAARPDNRSCHPE